MLVMVGGGVFASNYNTKGRVFNIGLLSTHFNEATL